MRVAAIATSPNEIRTRDRFLATWRTSIPVDRFTYYPDPSASVEESGVVHFDRYDVLVVFNDISLLSQVIADYRRASGAPRLVMVQEGSTDFTFEARKYPLMSPLRSLSKLSRYSQIAIRNVGLRQALGELVHYARRPTKPPYGHGIDKDVFVFSTDLEEQNYDGKSTTLVHMDDCSVEVRAERKPLGSDARFVLVHQPIYEQVGMEAHRSYYARAIETLTKRGAEVIVRLHPRVARTDPVVQMARERSLATVVGDSPEQEARDLVWVGYSSTFLLTKMFDGRPTLHFEGGLPPPRNLFGVIAFRHGNVWSTATAQGIALVRGRTMPNPRFQADLDRALGGGPPGPARPRSP